MSMNNHVKKKSAKLFEHNTNYLSNNNQAGKAKKINFPKKPVE